MKDSGTTRSLAGFRGTRPTTASGLSFEAEPSPALGNTPPIQGESQIVTGGASQGASAVKGEETK